MSGVLLGLAKLLTLLLAAGCWSLLYLGVTRLKHGPNEQDRSLRTASTQQTSTSDSPKTWQTTACRTAVLHGQSILTSEIDSPRWDFDS